MKNWKSFIIAVMLLINIGCKKTTDAVENISPPISTDTVVADTQKPEALDTVAYNKLMQALANGDPSGKWPIKAPYPNKGAILPYHRIVAFYGNLYSKNMGILGQLPEDEMVEQLKTEAKKWEAADTTTPVKMALHYIAVTAQKSPGKGNKYRLRMPDKEIDKVLEMAKKIDAMVFLDIQVGQSTLKEELPQLDEYLKLPNVHLGIDPEFSMKTDTRPGKKVGTYNAEDINYAIKYLEGLVKLYKLPPKILVVHRFTKKMVTEYDDIKPLPDVQIVMHMDGWGGPAKKKGTYRQVIFPQPVQFTGFKIFYKNDTEMVNRDEVMQPEEILKLVPKPIYIQYQ